MTPERLDLMRDGDAFFLTQLDALDDDALAAPSRLQGWTRANVVTHIARNADALCNLVEWARTGVERPMYGAGADRDKDIAAGAARPPAIQRADVRSTSDRLLGACHALPASAWDTVVKTRMGRDVPASVVPWMRVRESWVHAVDLDAGATFADVPDAVITPLLDEVASGLIGRDDCPPMTIMRLDAAQTWRVGTADAPTEVRGSGAVLLGWLLGRETLDAPMPPPWL